MLQSDITTLHSGIIFNPVNCQNQLTEPTHQALISMYPKLKRKYHQFALKYPNPDDRFGLIQLIKLSDTISVANAYTIFDTHSTSEDDIRINEYTLKETLTRFNTYVNRLQTTGYIQENSVPNWNSIKHFILENTNLTIVKNSK